MPGLVLEGVSHQGYKYLSLESSKTVQGMSPLLVGIRAAFSTSFQELGKLTAFKLL